MTNLMVFYNGALSYSDLEEMTVPEFVRLTKEARRVRKEME